MSSAEGAKRQTVRLSGQASKELGFPLPGSLRIAEVAAALSQALDLGSGAAPQHSLRTCVLGMRIASEAGVSERLHEALFYALLLRGTGRNASIKPHTKPTALIPDIALLAELLDACSFSAGPDAALTFVAKRGPAWFGNGRLVEAACALHRSGRLWAERSGPELSALVVALDPKKRTLAQDYAKLDAICQVIAAAVDDRSALTYNHSKAVAEIAVAIAARLSIEPARTELVHYAALLHDLGKLAVPREILHKPGPLTDAEWQIMRGHVEYTWRVLKAIPGFERLAEIAGSHHERLDGSGYFRGLTARELPIESRIVMVADVFDALSSERPYRPALPGERVLALVRNSIPHALDAVCVEALEHWVRKGRKEDVQARSDVRFRSERRCTMRRRT